MVLVVEGRKRAAETAHEERAWLAWHTAALHRAKRMTSLPDLIGKKKRAPKKRAMSADAMLTMARMWSAVAPREQGT